MIDIGVANPRAHGHATIRTETALMTANAIEGGGPNTAQAMNAMTAETTTAGTK